MDLIKPLFSKQSSTPTLNLISQPKAPPQTLTPKRRFIGIILSTICLSTQLTTSKQETAIAVDWFQMVAPDQTLEEAENVVRDHARAVARVKDLIQLESWKDLQKELRQSSSFLKHDIYTIIQGKPGSERPELRRLYSQLFNNVTRLDYAARDEDVTKVEECYRNIIMALDDIMSKI